MANEFEKFIDPSFDMLAVLDLNGKFKSVNRAFTQALGWSLDDLVDKSFGILSYQPTNWISQTSSKTWQKAIRSFY